MLTRVLLILIILFDIINTQIQDSTSQIIKNRNVFFMDGIIVTATRKENNIYDLPLIAHIITNNDIITKIKYTTIPELLSELPGIMIQKTSHGQGSPYIRGFVGNRILFMIDGIRFNNSVLREGPNQYWNTVDQFIIQKMEIVKGPNSTLYGSDAIGGSVNVITQQLKSTQHKFYLDPHLFYRYSTGENSNIVNGSLNGNITKKFCYHIGSTYKNYGNLRGGKEVGLQKRTGYTWLGLDSKIEYLINSKSRVIFVSQGAKQNNVWRTHKTIFGINWAGLEHGTEKKRILNQGFLKKS